MLKLEYPVLLYTPKYMMGSIQLEKSLLVVGEEKLDNGCFKNAIIVDSLGRRFRVLDFTKKRNTLNPLNFIYRYRTIWVDLKLEEVGLLSLNDFKEEILGLLRSNKKWYSKYDETISEIELRLSAPKSIDGIINTITIYP